MRNLEKGLGGDIRVCDRTALILDIFNQRAATHEAALQVKSPYLKKIKIKYLYITYKSRLISIILTVHSKVPLAQMEYQLPRLTRMWSHLERQGGGQVKGMGEKQIEVDKRILREQVSKIVPNMVKIEPIHGF